MDRPTLRAIEDHLIAALRLAEKADIGLVIYLINVILMDVRDRLSGKIKEN